MIRKHTSITFMVTTALLVFACTTAAPTAAPTVAPTVAPTAAPTDAPTTAPTDAPTDAPTAEPMTYSIGVVTDVGTIDDKNFNEYSHQGAALGATAVGAEAPGVAVPDDASQYASLIQDFVDTGHNIIVTVGFNLATDTAIAAKANPDVWFIGVDAAPCIDENGDPDSTFTCAGDLGTLLPNFIGLQYAEDQAGYLAGIVAASISGNDNVGAIGGTAVVPAVVKYIQGYELGAKSVNPDINVFTSYITDFDFGLAFNDPGAGKTFAEQFIQTNDVDVLFQVAGKTGNGMLQAACAANIHGLGVDVDQWLSLNAATDPSYGCVVTSAEKHLSNSVRDTIMAIAAGSATGGLSFFNATNDGVGISPENSGAGLITADVQALIDTALAGMQDGSLVTCPENCGTAE